MTRIFTAILGGLLFLYLSSLYEIGQLEDVNEELAKTLSDKNTAIKVISINYKKKLKEYENKQKVKYVTRYITKEINVTRSDCNDTKNLLSELRRIGIN